MNQLIVNWIRQEEHRFTTTGDWQTWEPASWNDENNPLTVTVTRLPDWRYTMCVCFHELIEACWCKLHGVTTEECDRFDEYYEGLYKSGKAPVDKDAGDDRSCPYFRGHQWGKLFERIVAFVLKVKWKDYDRAASEADG